MSGLPYEMVLGSVRNSVTYGTRCSSLVPKLLATVVSRISENIENGRKHVNV